MNKQEQLLAKPLDQFTHDELSSLRSYMMGRDVQNQMSLLWDAEASKRALKAANQFDRRLAARQQKEQQRAAIDRYIRKHVQPGDFLRFAATRCEGYRGFVKYQDKDQRMVCFVADRGSGGRIKLSTYSSTNHIDHLIAHYPNQGVTRSAELMILDANTPVVSRTKMLEIDAMI